VIGFSDKWASQAELVLVEASDLTRKPENVSWEVAGGLFVAGTTAWGAVRAVRPGEGSTSPGTALSVPGHRRCCHGARTSSCVAALWRITTIR
jgi:NADPH:quinone reductase-like Zn-dependent oxidoreductase